MTRCWIHISLALILCLATGTAHAESRIAVRPFFGPHADDVRRDVVSILEKHRELALVPNGEVEQRGKRLKMDPNSPEGRVAIASALNVAAWVEAIVQKHGKELRATVLIYDGREHRRIGRTVLTRRTSRELSSALRRSFWKENRDALLSADAPTRGSEPSEDSAEEPSEAPEALAEAGPQEEEPAEAPPSDEPSPETIAPAEPTAPAETPASSSMALGKAQTFSSARWNVSPAGASDPVITGDALFATLTLGTLSRTLKYEDARTQSLGNYSLGVAPQASLDVRYFPAAHFTAKWPSYFGLDLKAQLALAAASETRTGDKYATWADAYGIGARGRIPFGKHEASLIVAYGVQRVQFADSRAKPSPTPDVDYRFARTGAEGDFELKPKLRLGASAAWLWLLAAGEIASSEWFPRTTGSGIEASVFGSYGLTAHLDLVATIGLAHYFFTFHPKKGDPKVAGGATDDFVTGGLGIRLRL